MLDGTTLDELYPHQIELVSYHWSGKHQEVVKGINAVTRSFKLMKPLLGPWTSGRTTTNTMKRPGMIISATCSIQQKKTWSCVALCPNRQLIFRYGGSQTCQEASMAFFTLLNSNLLVKEVKSGYIAISEVNILDGGGLVHFWWIWFN